ncbi:MAG: hypothetical protein NTZ11_18345 [Gammaproteobacteria bacterium]|nr:hypothetical protein [Gammaproteobacteria bacterium]
MTVIADLWAMVKDSREWKAMAEASKKIPELEARIAALEKRGGSSGYVCDHCASPDLVRTGSRPDPVFGELGHKQHLFRCNACGKESAFLPKNER